MLCVVVLGLVVHDQQSIHKVETVRLGLPWARLDACLDCWVEVRHAVNNLPGVCRARHDKREREVITFDQDVPEVVSFNHAEVTDFQFPDGEFQACANGLEVQERSAKVVTNRAYAVVRVIRWQLGVIGVLPHLEKQCLSVVLQSPDLEGSEVDLVDIGTQGAKEALRRGSQLVHVLRSDSHVWRCHSRRSTSWRMGDQAHRA
mmetsp:Transcript_76313/g.150906  ORF Transcript_76313/g.150906 Transcript_76313/m.150906 type:complete len:203 (+) Transcript_76313:223-831(+)